MLENYILEIEHITRGFEKKKMKKLKIDSLISLNKKLLDYENTEIDNSLLELKRILKRIEDKEPKQNLDLESM